MGLDLLNLDDHSGKDEVVAKMCLKTVEDIKEKKCTVLSLVEELGILLMANDKDKRKTGIEILSLVLSQLPLDILNSSEITFLLDYYFKSLLDHHSMIPAVLNGVLSLVTMEEFSSSIAEKLFTVFNLHFICQTQQKEDRLTYYKILFQLTKKCRKELLNLGPDFVFGFLSAISREQDAVNLLYIFKNLPNFFHSFPLGHLTEDAFEVCSNYFPIDYEGSENVRREELAEHLNNCLVATEEFADGAVNLALDKLTSSLKVAKLDSLTLLKISFEKFPSERISPFIRTIAYTLWQEVRTLDNLDDDVRNETYNCVAVLIKSLNLQSTPDKLSTTVDNISKGMLGYITDVNFVIFIPTLNFLLRISNVSASICEFMSNKLLPILSEIKVGPLSEVIKKQKAINSVMKICCLYKVNPSEQISVKPVWNEIVQLFLNEINNILPEVQIEVVLFLSYAVTVLSKNHRQDVFAHFYKQLSNSNLDVRKKSMKGLKHASEVFPEEVEFYLLEQFNENESGISEDAIKKNITLLCNLSQVQPAFSPCLRNYVQNYATRENYKYVSCVIQTLKDYIIGVKSGCSIFGDVETACYIIVFLRDTWLKNFSQYQPEVVSENVSLILVSLFSSLETELQVRYLKVVLKEHADYSEMEISITILESMVCGLRQEALAKLVEDILPLMEKILNAALYVDHMRNYHSLGRIVASVINKTKIDSVVEKVYSIVQNTISSVLDNKQEQSVKVIERALLLLAYVIKGLLLRNFPTTADLLIKYLDYINEESTAEIVSNGFRILLDDDKYFLNDSCHVDIKLNNKQILFNSTAFLLLNKAKETTSPLIKSSCMKAITYQLLSVDYPAQCKIINQALPQFIEVISDTHLSTSDVSLMILKTFKELLKNKEPVFRDYVNTLISKLLTFTSYQSSMEIRICSLECLYYYGHYETYLLLPLKSQVITELMPCLDDGKRLVRREAVITRCHWFTIGTS